MWENSVAEFETAKTDSLGPEIVQSAEGSNVSCNNIRQWVVGHAFAKQQ